MFKNTHYKRYPIMEPWVGINYYAQAHKRLLIVGESHYLPSESNKSSDVDKWYKDNQNTLTQKERVWISTSGIIKENWMHNFPNKAHGIYRNFSKAINSASYDYSNPSEVMNDLAFMNYFQRPAECKGGSIHVHKKDREVSKEVLTDIIETLKPELVVFVSSKASWDGDGVKLVEKFGIPVTATPHPTCQWWNRQTQKYGGYGREIIPRFLNQNEWCKLA